MSLLVWSLPIVSGFADALSRGVIKLTKVHRFTLVAAGYLFALPFYLPLLYVEGVPVIQPAFWWVLAAHVPLLVLAQVLTVEAHRASPLILTAPYLSLTPAFLLVTAPLMGGGTPNGWGALGVLIITIGLYALNTKEGQTESRDFLEPFRAIGRERGSWLMLIVSVIFAMTANLDYLGLQNANASFYLLIDHGVAGAACASLAFVYWRSERIQTSELLSNASGWALILYGLAIAASVIPHMLAFWWIPLVPYVIAGKRAGVIIFSVAIGIAISFLPRFDDRYREERAYLTWRLIGVALVIIGMLMIIFWGRT